MVIQTYPCALPLPTYLFSLFKLKHQYTEPHSMQLSTTKGPDFANFNGRDTKIPNSLSLDTPVTIKQTRNFQKLAALASYRIMKAPSLPPPGLVLIFAVLGEAAALQTLLCNHQGFLTLLLLSPLCYRPTLAARRQSRQKNEPES